ncbi:hypothetical protein RCL1_002411 [Eukaryota sp. TZLM3-RCL]
MRFLLFVLLLTVITVSATDVLELTSENYQSVLSSKKLVLIKYYAPWCGHCKSLAPEYEEAAKTLQSSLQTPDIVTLAEINCDNESELCQNAGIQGFPTLHLFRDGEQWLEYQGQRQAKDIVEFVEKMTLPLIPDLEPTHVEKFLEVNPVAVLVYLDSEAPEFTVLSNVAAKFVDKVQFVRIPSEEKPKVEIRKAETGETFLFEGDLTNEEEVYNFIESNRKPLLIELDRNTFKDVFVENAGPIGILFVDPQVDSWKPKYTAAAQKLKELGSTAQLTYIDGIMYSKFMERLGHDSIPAFTIVLLQKNAHFNQPQFSLDDIPAFVEEVVEGKVSKYVRGEAVPSEEEQAQSAARIVVRDNFEAEVLTPVVEGHDVVVLYWAPFCSHCVSFKPAFEEFATIIRDANIKVKVASFNADANDIPEEAGFELQGYPTVIIYPAAKSREEVVAVEHSGERSVAGLVAFLKDHAKTEIPDIQVTEVEAEGDDLEEEIEADEL